MEHQDHVVLRRQEFYEKVWSTPITTLCKLYNLSDNGLRKICRKMEIPTTPIGYWSKIKFGKKVNVLPLPPPGPNTIMQYDFYIMSKRTGIKKPLSLPDVKLIKNLNNPHILISNTLQYINDSKSIDWKEALQLKITSTLRKRGLLLLNTIFKELEARGCKIKINREDNYLRGFPSASIDDVFIHFDLRELTNMKKIEKRASPYDNKVEWVFNKKFELRIHDHIGDYLRKNFTDSSKHTVEGYLPEIINNIRAGIDFRKEFLIRREEERKEEERQSKLEEIERNKQVEEKKKFGNLQKMAFQLTTYNATQLLISQIRLKFVNELTSNIKLKEWLSWAEQVVENNNPIGSIDFLSIFEDIKKEEQEEEW